MGEAQVFFETCDLQTRKEIMMLIEKAMEKEGQCLIKYSVANQLHEVLVFVLRLLPSFRIGN